MFYPGFFKNPSLNFGKPTPRTGPAMAEKWKSPDATGHWPAWFFWRRVNVRLYFCWLHSAPLSPSRPHYYWVGFSHWVFVCCFLSCLLVLSAAVLLRLRRVRISTQNAVEDEMTGTGAGGTFSTHKTDNRTDATICPSFVNKILPDWSQELHEILLHNVISNY